MDKTVFFKRKASSYTLQAISLKLVAKNLIPDPFKLIANLLHYRDQNAKILRIDRFSERELGSSAESLIDMRGFTYIHLKSCGVE
jgi:hypothetical protein